MCKIHEMSIAVLAVFVLFFGSIALYEKGVIEDKQAIITGYETANKILSEESERENNKTIKTIERIKKEYVPKYVYIDNYIGDENASECKNAINLLRAVEY